MIHTYSYLKSILFLSLFLGIIFTSCENLDRNETTLSNSEKQFISDLGILDSTEIIELFESNAGMKGYKESGNFITSKRIASYWLDDNDRDIHSAFYSEIDSITETDLVTKPTYASYLTIYKNNGEQFNVYIDADSSRTYHFFQTAQSNWKKNYSIIQIVK